MTNVFLRFIVRLSIAKGEVKEMTVKKIIDYDFVCSFERSPDSFLQHMKAAIKNGWQPYGSPNIEHDYRVQAMVKYEE